MRTNPVLLAAALVTACSGASDGGAGADGARADTVAEALTCWKAPTSGEAGDALEFDDATAEYGLLEPLTGMYGHAAAWGDINADGLPDLFVGTFADRPEDEYRHRGASGPSPDIVVGHAGDSFSATGFPEVYGRTTGAAFADLDGDGHLDLVVARNPRSGERQTAPTTVYRGHGDGTFEPVESPGIDRSLGGRSVGVLDHNDDGKLDLFLVEDVYAGGASRLYQNAGDLSFEDVTEAARLPPDLHGLGLATGDVNLDGFTDLFVGGSNRLFVGGEGGFREAPSGVFEWETYGDEDLVAGAVFGDVNRDGWPDLVVGQHFNSTVDAGRQVPVRLYLNHTEAPGDTPSFVDVTAVSGLVNLPTKAPDVSLADMNNDGWPDLVTTAAADDGTGPAVFRHSGTVPDGIPQFEPPEGLGASQYWVSGPVADVNRDGRLDLFLVEWDPAMPSLLLRNTSNAGHWISVSVGLELGGGPGTRVEALDARNEELIAGTEIVASAGYTSGTEMLAHLGVGTATSVNLRVSPPRAHEIVLRDIPVDRHIRLPDGC